MPRQLNHAGDGVVDQVLVSLHQDPGLSPPESVVCQELVNHPLSKQLPERGPALVDQREDHVAKVPVHIDRQGLAGFEGPREGSSTFVRLEHPPWGGSAPGYPPGPETLEGFVGLSGDVAKPPALEVILDQVPYNLVLPGRARAIHPRANDVATGLLPMAVEIERATRALGASLAPRASAGSRRRSSRANAESATAVVRDSRSRSPHGPDS